MKKHNLPKHWIVVKSKTHQDRVYYFNIKTNESSWNEPTEDNIDKTPDMETERTREKKINSRSSIALRSKTPDLEDKDVNNKSNVQKMLIHKRTFKESSQELKRKTPDFEDEEVNNKSNVRQKLVAKRFKPVQNVDTHQMKDLRRKIELKKEKSNNKNSFFTNSFKSETTSSRSKKIVISETTTSKSDKPETVTSKSETMTPQMRVIYEKLQKKNMEKKGSKPLEPVNIAKDINVVDNIQSTVKENNRRSTRNTRISMAKPSSSSQIMSPTSRNSERNLTENVSKNFMRTSMKRKLSKELSPTDKKYKSELTTTEEESKTSNEIIINSSTSDIFKKNLAMDRMEKLRKSINIQTKDEKNSEFPDVYKNSDTRHRHLHNRLLSNKIIPNKEELLMSVKTNILDQSNNESCDNFANKSSSIYEEMDWEPLEDEEITFEVQAARIKLCTQSITNEKLQIEGNILQFPSQEENVLQLPSQEENKILYIVVDTNVFLSNLNAVIETMNRKFITYNKPIIVIPWTVIRELDYLKVAKSKKSLRDQSRKAIQFLNNHFSAKDPRIVGQTLQDVMNNKQKFAAECPDDEILQVCLQIREAGKAVALLSYDKNLCNKAMISDILALGRDDPLEKIDYIFSNKNTILNFHDISNPRMQDESSQVISAFQEELRYFNELYEEVESVMQEFLSVIVSKEMKKLYDETWEKYVIVKPPWTVLCVLKCAIKHWIAATSEVFDREALNYLKELLEMFKALSEGSRRLKDIVHLLDKCSDLIQTININKYSELMTRALSAIQDLQQRCNNYEIKICEKKLLEKIGRENDDTKQKHRAEVAFNYFEHIYSYARDYGGMAASIVGMPNSLFFQTPNPLPTPDHVIKIQSELSRNVNHLLRALTNCILEMENSCLDHKTLINLYQILKNFLPENTFREDLSPLDLYCCLKVKEDQLKQGIKQLQELCTHYSKLSSFRSM
ncbi:transcriptional protein SWT1-like isoform X2 [Polistes fuscatus]|uniref:transcriptional protein SWT1-like isoform X2 n=1 Tax=Polistes fuscatus TaxID=30207 RepID=UPI001CA9A730|nr:transcriptional protein SWT1-like isoform X2 [Polistes fuscatus]